MAWTEQDADNGNWSGISEGNVQWWIDKPLKFVKDPNNIGSNAWLVMQQDENGNWVGMGFTDEATAMGYAQAFGSQVVNNHGTQTDQNQIPGPGSDQVTEAINNAISGLSGIIPGAVSGLTGIANDDSYLDEDIPQDAPDVVVAGFGYDYKNIKIIPRKVGKSYNKDGIIITEDDNDMIISCTNKAGITVKYNEDGTYIVSDKKGNNLLVGNQAYEERTKVTANGVVITTPTKKYVITNDGKVLDQTKYKG